MRIRRNQWLTYLLAASITVCATANARAQGTTATISSADSATTSSAAPVFNKLEIGDQLIYKTKGSVAMQGLGQGKDQKEDLDLTTSLTVLQKSGDKLTLYAVLTAAEETTAGKTSVPGPRFTFELPVSGAAPNEEFEKAGLSGASFPTFSVETLFATPAPEGKSSSSISLPVTNAMLEGEAVTTREGANLKTVTSASQETTPVLTRTTMFSSEKNLTESIETSVSMSLAARNMPITISISDKTNLVSVTKIPADKLKALKDDVESAIPIAAKLRTLNSSSPDVMKVVLEETTKYLATYPNGEFAFIFDTLQGQLSSAVKRTANWDKIKKGEAAPDFTAKTIDNKTIKLSDLKGKVVLIDFWATWCGPCLQELPNVKKLYADSKDKDFQIIGISADEDIADLQKLVQDEDIQWPQVYDADQTPSVQEAYGVMKFPTTILVDKEGKINAVDLRGEELDKAVNELLGAAK